MTASTERDEPIAEITLDGEDPRLNWKSPGANGDSHYHGGTYTSNGRESPVQGYGYKCNTCSKSEPGDHTQQKRGPEVEPPCFPLITLRDGAEAGPRGRASLFTC